ncbi:MAG: hypothetical protein V3W01_00185 [Dehalococcoidales bacterium]
MKMQIRFIVAISLLLVYLFTAGCAGTQSFDARLGPIVKPYRFDLIAWELGALSYKFNESLFGNEVTADEVSVVIDYFSLTEQARALEREIRAVRDDIGIGNLASLEAQLDMLLAEQDALESRAERIMEKQISQTLALLGIFNPVDNYMGLQVNFPPLNFRLEEPPHLLVVSPRDRIESIRQITLLADISAEEMEDIEAAVDELDVSSLVVGLGGIATYPAFVANDAGLRFAINAAIEEWLHQYLFFKPVGFLYALHLIGASQNYEIATINEALVGIASDEIGSILYQNYYSQYERESSQTEATEPGFDFNREMREIRKAVDDYLAAGEIEKAEEFMEQKRLFLVSKGYFIKKLNQAYFAFYGTYADSPTSINPIGAELRALRGQSPSVKSFLETAAAMTSRDDLIGSIK